MSSPTTLRATALALLLLSSSAAADVIVVASDGSGDFAQINQAIVAASDGDTLLVRSGTYAAFVVNAKALTIVADVGESVFVDGYAAVTNLPAGKSVLLSGLTTMGVLPTHPGLFLMDDAGSVRVRNCMLSGFTPAPSPCLDFETLPPGQDGAFVSGCSDVALVACSLRGGNGGSSDDILCLDNGGRGGRGMRIEDSRVTLHDTSVIGGRGGESGYGGDGGIGVDVHGQSELFAAGGSIHGGAAGLTNDVIDICGNGGIGLFTDAAAESRLLDTLVQGGPKWDGPFRNCSFDGANFGGSGAVTQYSGAARGLESLRVAREATVAHLTVHGEPGDRVWLGTAAPGYRHEPLLRGTHLLRAPAALRFVGTVSGTGTLDVPVAIPPLPTGSAARTQHFQVLVSSVADGQLLGGATQLVIVDAAY